MWATRTDDAANDYQLVHHRCQFWQQFTNLDACYVGIDRFELSANLIRRIRFEIPQILVGRATREKNVIRPLWEMPLLV